MNEEPPISSDQPPFVLSYGTSGSVKWVTVARAGSGFEAGLIRNMLENEGIRSFVPNLESGAVHPAMSVGGFPIQVEQSDAERAREILKNTPVGRGPPAAITQCPACGFHRSRRRRIWLLPVAILLACGGITLYLLGLPLWPLLLLPADLLPFFIGSLTCARCGKAWALPEHDDD
jgi:hypothetical protein